MAKHYKKYNADNKNKSQNIIKKTFMPPRDYATANRFSKLYVYRKSTTIKSAPPPTLLCAHKKILLRIRDPWRPRRRTHPSHPQHNHHRTPNRPVITNTTTPYSPKIRPPHHITQKRNHQTQQHTDTQPRPTYTATKETPKHPSHAKMHKKMADFRHFLTTKHPSHLLSRPASGCFYGIICNF